MWVQAGRNSLHGDLQSFFDLAVQDSRLAAFTLNATAHLCPRLQTSGCSTKFSTACRLGATYLVSGSFYNVLEELLRGLLAVLPWPGEQAAVASALLEDFQKDSS